MGKGKGKHISRNHRFARQTEVSIYNKRILHASSHGNRHPANRQNAQPMSSLGSSGNLGCGTCSKKLSKSIFASGRFGGHKHRRVREATAKYYSVKTYPLGLPLSGPFVHVGTLHPMWALPFHVVFAIASKASSIV